VRNFVLGRASDQEGLTQADTLRIQQGEQKRISTRMLAGFPASAQKKSEVKDELWLYMKRIVIRQAVVVSILGVLLCVALLLGVLLLLASIAGTHPSQTGIMLIASPSHLA
jgi:hypothetical protein